MGAAAARSRPDQDDARGGELQRAGGIPFVHRSGGPVEIVGETESLMFRTAEEGEVAAEKFCEGIRADCRRICRLD